MAEMGDVVGFHERGVVAVGRTCFQYMASFDSQALRLDAVCTRYAHVELLHAARPARVHNVLACVCMEAAFSGYSVHVPAVNNAPVTLIRCVNIRFLATAAVSQFNQRFFAFASLSSSTLIGPAL